MVDAKSKTHQVGAEAALTAHKIMAEAASTAHEIVDYIVAKAALTGAPEPRWRRSRQVTASAEHEMVAASTAHEIVREAATGGSCCRK